MTTTQLSIVTATLAIFSMMAIPAFASHGNGGYEWNSEDQEFFCETSWPWNLAYLDLTSAVDPACDVIEDSADLWTDLSDPSWSLTKSNSNAINQRAENMGSNGDLGEMVPYHIFGTMISAFVKYNTEVAFGDVDTDDDVYDFPSVAIHELGHLPTLYHNEHSGTSVMDAGLDLNEKRRNITSDDEDAVDGKYP